MIHPNGYNDVWQLDYNNEALVTAMNDCLKFWIDQADIDGYRCDYSSSSRIPTNYWQTAIPLILSRTTRVARPSPSLAKATLRRMLPV